MDTHAPLFFRCALAVLAFASALLTSGCGGGDGSNGASGPFGSPVFTEMGGGPSSLAWGDLNADGKVDVVFTLRDNKAFAMLGSGDGTFQSARAISGLSAIYPVAVGDLNGDGKVDLVVTGCPIPACPPSGPPPVREISLVTMLGNGDGTFQTPVMYPMSSASGALAIGDFNGDGHPDVATGNTDLIPPVVSLRLGNGDGTLKPATDWPAYPYNSYLIAGSILVADMNADGKPDLVVFQSEGFLSFVGVLIGRGDGTFNAPLVQGIGQYPGQQAIVDLNHDGKLDVATSGSQSGPPGGPGQVIVVPGNGDGTLGAATYPAYPHVYANPSFAASDVNGDGISDLVVRPSATTDLAILYGTSAGAFLPAQAFPISLSGSVDRLIDVNGDGRPDLVLVTATGIAVLLNAH